MKPIQVDQRLVEERIFTLARYGAHGETGVWRTVYSPEWEAAQAQIEEWCRGIGLATRRDAVGSVWGRLEGSEGGPAIASGSHIDSQTPGGRYDGALGVIAALTAVQCLREQAGEPRRALEVVSLCEEEASRFHAANFWGSRAITGKVRPQDLEEIRDAEGVGIGDAMRAAGLDPGRVTEARRDDIETFLELHIEQGPVLEEAGLPVGVVNAITGIRHSVLEVSGRSDHAGARPMIGRKDPMAAAAEIVTGVVANALEMGAPAVTTVGRMLVEPNLPAAVPDKVTFTVDARHPDAARRDELYALHEALIDRVVEERGLAATRRIVLDLPPCPCDPELVALLERSARHLGVPSLTMHSGAAHDSQRMADVARVAMLFVRSKDGRSHTPAEFTSVEDAVEGIRVLAAALHELAY